MSDKSFDHVASQLIKRMYDECGSEKAEDFVRRVKAGEHDVPSPWQLREEPTMIRKMFPHDPDLQEEYERDNAKLREEPSKPLPPDKDHLIMKMKWFIRGIYENRRVDERLRKEAYLLVEEIEKGQL